jgi:hypothetical protein
VKDGQLEFSFDSERGEITYEGTLKGTVRELNLRRSPRTPGPPPVRILGVLA